jgi:hypothetical protein
MTRATARSMFIYDHIDIFVLETCLTRFIVQ